jgi:hypothetical protein
MAKNRIVPKVLKLLFASSPSSQGVWPDCVAVLWCQVRLSAAELLQTNEEVVYDLKLGGVPFGASRIG